MGRRGQEGERGAGGRGLGLDRLQSGSTRRKKRQSGSDTQRKGNRRPTDKPECGKAAPATPVFMVRGGAR